MMIRRIFILLAVLLLAIVGAVTFELLQPRALPTHFPAGASTCYGRLYDSGYLGAHPHHLLAALYLFEKPSGRGQRLNLTLAARFRDDATIYREVVECDKDIGSALCFRDCDIALFRIRVAGWRSLSIDPQGQLSFIRLNASCGSGQGPVRRIDFKTGGADLRLDLLSDEECRPARDPRTRD